MIHQYSENQPKEKKCKKKVKKKSEQGTKLTCGGVVVKA